MRDRVRFLDASPRGRAGRSRPAHGTRTRVRRIAQGTALAAFITLAANGPVAAQAPGQGGPRRLTLDDAVALARSYNPTYLSTRNDVDAAEWAAREATTNLLLPQANALGSLGYQAPGVQRVGTINTGGEEQGALFTSFYQFQLSYTLDGTRWFGRASARADRDAAKARTEAAAFDLESAVTLQYMTVLRARDQLEVARRQLERSEEDLEIARARVAAQAAIVTDAKQAEVQRGRDEVAVLQAESALRVETFRLMEQLGLPLDEHVELVDEFVVFEPTWTAEELVSYALERHPQLQAFVAQERARKADVRTARSAYFPRVTLSGTWSGFTQEIENENFLIEGRLAQARRSIESCELFNRISQGLTQPLPDFPQDCSAFAVSDAELQSLVASNDIFPFNFRRIPFQAQLTVSLPIFQGFGRERQVAQAAAQYQDAVNQRRAEELRLRTAVTSAYDALRTSHRVVEIEERNREVAREQLDLARQRYRLGADNFLTLLDAQRTMADAERAYLDAVYTFHVQLAALEQAVGRRLRPDSEPGPGGAGAEAAR